MTDESLSRTRTLGTATAGLIAGDETTDVLSRLLRDCAEAVGAAAIGLLVVTANSDVDLLAATSHNAAELELYQLQQSTGPCLDAIRTGHPTSGVGVAEIVAKWPDVGPAIIAAGYLSVRAYPMRWHDVVLGAMNVFGRDDEPPDSDQDGFAQAVADLATLTVARVGALSVAELHARIATALESRTIIEQAKGVLAYRHQTDAGAAYQLLLDRAASARAGLAATARDVVAEATGRGR